MKTIVIIPTRMRSNRLPGKPLKVIGGTLTVIWSCYLNALASGEADQINVASANVDIINAVAKQTAFFIKTSDKAVNGTERVAEAARILQLQPDDIVVNLQGDMPFFEPEIIDNPVRLMKELPNCNAASVMTDLLERDRDDPNKVKVVINRDGRATSFSREYPSQHGGHQKNAYLHIGVYVFRNSFLQRYNEHGAVTKEKQTHLEQQRIMFMGEPVCMAYAEKEPITINVEEDLKKAKSRYEKEQSRKNPGRRFK